MDGQIVTVDKKFIPGKWCGRYITHDNSSKQAQ
jgi:hypothetical protein